MATTPALRRPARRGKPICFTIDDDAESLLRALVQNSNGMGLFLSELIRKEARERVGRAHLLATLEAMGEARAAESGA